MKFAVIGGTGLIGSRVVENLNAAGHQAVPHSLSTGVDIITGQGLEAAVSMTTDGDTVRLPRTPIQPIAAADVSNIVAEVAAGSPLNGVVNIAGPDVYPLDELGRLTLTAQNDGRSVVTDDTAGMFAAVHGDVLTARNDARIAPTHYTDWLS